MAQIDLKNAIMYIRDGYTGPGGDAAGAVNFAAGYIAGNTVLVIDAFVGLLVVNDYVTIAGSTSGGVLIKHRITAVTGSPNTTGITVTPALGGVVADNAIITILPHQLEINIGEGKFNYSEKVKREYVRDRGRLSSVRNGDEDPVEVSFDFIWDFIKGDTGKVPTIEDALKKRGQAANWVSTSADPCEPYCVDIYIEYDTPCSTDDDETIFLQYFRHEELAHDLRGASIACSGKCNVLEASAVRA